jgi:hypothetical protein
MEIASNAETTELTLTPESDDERRFLTFLLSAIASGDVRVVKFRPRRRTLRMRFTKLKRIRPRLRDPSGEKDSINASGDAPVGRR